MRSLRAATRAGAPFARGPAATAVAVDEPLASVEVVATSVDVVSPAAGIALVAVGLPTVPPARAARGNVDSVTAGGGVVGGDEG